MSSILHFAFCPNKTFHDNGYYICTTNANRNTPKEELYQEAKDLAQKSDSYFMESVVDALMHDFNKNLRTLKLLKENR